MIAALDLVMFILRKKLNTNIWTKTIDNNPRIFTENIPQTSYVVLSSFKQ